MKNSTRLIAAAYTNPSQPCPDCVCVTELTVYNIKLDDTLGGTTTNIYVCQVCKSTWTWEDSDTLKKQVDVLAEIFGKSKFGSIDNGPFEYTPESMKEDNRQTLPIKKTAPWAW